MHAHRILKRILMLLSFTLSFVGEVRAAPAPWPDASFTFIAEKQSLPELLGAFCRNFGIELQASSAVLARTDLVSGKYTTATPTEFLNQLSSTYGLQWFYHGGTLYFSRNFETATRSITPAGISLPDFRKALTDLGIVESKFGWGELPNRGVAMVSGPPAYVDLVVWAVASLPLPQPEQQMRVFRLKHAQVNDRVISYRDQQITTAGIASILRNLVSGTGSAGGTLFANTPQLASLLTPLRSVNGAPETPEERPSKASGSEAPESNEMQAKSKSQQPLTRAVIQADSRLNALIIRDLPQHMPAYEELIKLLDVPSKLIEIEAVIVDVNSSDVSELGIDWGARVGNIAGGFGQPALAPDFITGTVVIGKGVNPSTVIPNAGNFLMSRIRLLEGKGSARIVSRPSVLTVDNLGALIDLSETFYVQSIGERVASVVPIAVGTTLRVTPHIIDEGGSESVHLTVDIEDGSIQEGQTNQSLPRVRKSTIGTQAIMGEKESLLIGGFNAESDTRQVDQVPGLGNLPIFGIFFKKKSTKLEKRERLFLITPKIVSSNLAPPKKTE
jgi:type III secretion protein C